MEFTSEFILAVIAALGSVFSSIAAIKLIVNHENKMCDKRMEAFKEGLDRGENKH